MRAGPFQNPKLNLIIADRCDRERREKVPARERKRAREREGARERGKRGERKRTYA